MPPPPTPSSALNQPHVLLVPTRGGSVELRLHGGRVAHLQPGARAVSGQFRAAAALTSAGTLTPERVGQDRAGVGVGGSGKSRIKADGSAASNRNCLAPQLRPATAPTTATSLLTSERATPTLLANTCY